MPSCFISERDDILRVEQEAMFTKRKEDRRGRQTDSSGTKLILLKQKGFLIPSGKLQGFCSRIWLQSIQVICYLLCDVKSTEALGSARNAQY